MGDVCSFDGDNCTVAQRTKLEANYSMGDLIGGIKDRKKLIRFLNSSILNFKTLES